jgi:hypothetical protein
MKRPLKICVGELTVKKQIYEKFISVYENKKALKESF